MKGLVELLGLAEGEMRFCFLFWGGGGCMRLNGLRLSSNTFAKVIS